MRIRAYRFPAVLVGLAILNPPAICRAGETVDGIIAILDARDSAITSIQYTMTQVKHRTAEGTRLLADLYPGKVEKLDNPEAPARQGFARMRQGEKDRLENIHYEDDLKTVAGHILYTWDGSIGRQYIPESKSGRVQRQRFSVSEETLERATFEYNGKTLKEWLREAKDTATVTPAGDQIEVTFAMMPDMTAHCVLDKTKAYAVTRYEIIKGGEVAYTASVQEFKRCSVNGLDVFVPSKYESTMFYPRVNSREAAPKPEMVPLVKARVTVQTVTLNAPISDDMFVMKFPPDTTVYDEFLGRFIPTLAPNDVDASIRAQAEEWRPRLVEPDTATQSSRDAPFGQRWASPAQGATSPVGPQQKPFLAAGSVALISCCIAAVILLAYVIARYFRRNNTLHRPEHTQRSEERI